MSESLGTQNAWVDGGPGPITSTPGCRRQIDPLLVTDNRTLFIRILMTVIPDAFRCVMVCYRDSENPRMPEESCFQTPDVEMLVNSDTFINVPTTVHSGGALTAISATSHRCLPIIGLTFI
ncbi:hypothetical protein AHF37_03313 [Paragonimus kellicotti]|nr:hypothetical protein AHF37_03313 [Paragonimus kellicotti]